MEYISSDICRNCRGEDRANLKKEWKRLKREQSRRNAGNDFDQYLNDMINHSYGDPNSRRNSKSNDSPRVNDKPND